MEVQLYFFIDKELYHTSYVASSPQQKSENNIDHQEKAYDS